MKVLVTGAAGFLGRHFVQHHLEAGDRITAIDDLSSKGAHWLMGSYERYRVDAADLFRGWGWDRTFDLTYHFAAPVGGREKIEGDPLYNAGSLGLDAAFFRWAVDRAETVVYPSSSAVYGTMLQRDRGMPLHESLFDPAADVWPAPDEMYGFTKMAGEVLAQKAAKYGLNTLCIRPFSGYGEGQSLDYPIPAICARARRHEDPLLVWGSGHQTRDFIHVSDIVGATTALLDQGVSGYRAVNLGSGTATSFVEVARLAAHIAGYDPEIVTDATKPEGVSARYSDPSQMLAVYQPKVSLLDGLTGVMRSLPEEDTWSRPSSGSSSATRPASTTSA